MSFLLNNVHVLNNLVSNPGTFDHGGAITTGGNIGATFSLIDCVMTGNNGSEYGGALYVGGDIYIDGANVITCSDY